MGSQRCIILCAAASYLAVYKALNSVVVTRVDLVQIQRVIDIGPHVVVMLDVMIKALGTSLKLMTRQTTNKAHRFLVLLSAELKGGGL